MKDQLSKSSISMKAQALLSKIYKIQSKEEVLAFSKILMKSSIQLSTPFLKRTLLKEQDKSSSN
jgi:hypothetical protein